MTTDKKTLLYKIAGDELQRLLSMNRKELEKVYSEWFDGAFDEHIKALPSETLRDDLLEDFMMYREDESVEELLKLV